ncbi:MAG: phosphoribosylanthranilate isomerase [Fusobacteriota bacterium]
MRVKICGITNLKDALSAIENGASAIGFIFYPKSKRYIDPQKAKEIIKKTPPFVTSVGVFVNEDIENVKDIKREINLDLIQLHGDEDINYIRELEKNSKVMKAFRVKNKDVLDKIKKMNLDYFLLDAFDKSEYGGTGKRFNWEIAKKAKKLGQVILAGGININNVDEIIQRIKPYAIDISSGVEDMPGKKNEEKIDKFMGKIFS